MKMSKKALGLLIGSLAVIVLALGTGGVIYGIYFKSSENCALRMVAKTLRLPAAKVGKQSISYDSFVDTMSAVRRFIESEAGASVRGNVPPENELKKNIIERLIRQAMVQEVADEKKLTVSDDDVRKVFADVVAAAASSSQPDVAQYLYQNYGWNEEQFRQKVLRPALLEQKVGVELSKDKQGDANALEQFLLERRNKPDVTVYLQLK